MHSSLKTLGLVALVGALLTLGPRPAPAAGPIASGAASGGTASGGTVSGGTVSGGTVSGVVIDGLTGQPVRGALLTVEDTNVELTSDLGGAFRGTVARGTYSVLVTKDGFEPQRVTGVVITEQQVADFAVVLLPVSGSAAAARAAAGETAGEAAGEAAGENGTGLASAAGARSGAAFSEEITVTAEAASSTEAALLAERKGALGISDAIGAEEMKKNTGSDAAGALRRVTGISLQDNKYVFVRGLGERYSNTALNGSRIPSTEFEKKVVPLDLFPAELLDTLRVSKSYSADKPGDFAAGLVELKTLDFPLEQTASVGFSLGSSSVSTGKRFGQYGSGLSWSGSGGQPLPAGIPDEPLIRSSPINPSGFTPSELETYGEALIGQWTPTERSSAPYNGGYNATYGNTFGNLGLVVSGTYGHDYTVREEEQNYYRLAGNGGIAPLNTYDLSYSTEKVRRGLIANLAYRISDNHHLKLQTMFTDSSAAETRLQEGYYDDASTNIRDWKVGYKQQKIDTFQLSGEHFFELGPLGSLLEWRASTSSATTEENLREANYYEEGTGQLIFTDNAQSGFMYFNDLTDSVDDLAVDWTRFLSGDSYYGSLKLGAAYATRDRDFAGRRIRFFHRNTAGIDLTLPPDQILTAENIGPNGFELEEITRATDAYTGAHDISAGYVQSDLAFGPWRAVAGVRVERSEQEVVTYNPQKPAEEPIITRLADTDALPALSLVYTISDEANLRFAASQTVNRPEFRELAPFTFTNLVGGYAATGNPNLQRATIRSYDARWEWFPSGEEVVAASLFYKDFSDPIESVLVASVERLESYQNAQSARNYGAELEMRRTLGSVSPWLEGMTAICNLTWVDSEIQLSKGSILTNGTRPLVGQPDYVGNLVLEWASPDLGSTMRVLYNYTSDKVASAGAYGIPDVIETSRDTLDLVWRQDLGFLLDGLSIKLSASNLFNQEWLFTQGGEVYRRYEPGRTLGMSFSFTLF